MRVKKFGSKVYGADLTAAERKAMNLEIQRQLIEFDKKHVTEIAALVLWVLHSQQGWGEKRLRRFLDGFSGEIDALLKRYKMDEEDKVWCCTFKLKEQGIDVAKWLDES